MITNVYRTTDPHHHSCVVLAPDKSTARSLHESIHHEEAEEVETLGENVEHREGGCRLMKKIFSTN